MLSTKSAVYDAPAIADRVVEFSNSGNLPPYCVVENLSATSSASVKYQESDDGVTWTDIPGAVATVNPGESDGRQVTSARAKIALHVGGNLKVQFSVVRQVDGGPLSLGAA